MSKEQLTIVVEKEVYEMALNLRDFVGAVKQAMADGWQPGQDLPILLTAALTNLVPALQKINQIAPNLAEDKVAFVKALTLGLEEIAFLFV